MRMRKKKHTLSRIAACDTHYLRAGSVAAGDWAAHFGNQNPLHLELGCGKGSFIAALARQNPDVNYIALERERDCLVTAVERAKALDLHNVRFLSADVALLSELFEAGSCARIYLNFSDPWPKTRHAGRRLTHPDFLARYARVLLPTGEVHFKTDNKPLFAFSLKAFAACGWSMREETRDLHQSPFEAENIRTEYEQFFADRGVSICRVVASKPEPSHS